MSSALNNALYVAWNNYVSTHDCRALLDEVLTHPESATALQLILWQAIGRCDWVLVTQLLNAGALIPRDTVGDPSIISSALADFGDNSQVIDWLIANGADLEHHGPNDWTALHYACRQGAINAVRSLIAAGANINSLTNCDGGWTPLMEACVSGHLEIVQALIEAGVDADVRNSQNQTSAREIAAGKGYNSIVKVLDSASRKKAKY